MSWVKKIVIWSVALVALIFVFRMSYGRMIAKTDPERALNFYPDYSEALIRQNQRLLSGDSETDTDQVNLNARKILKKAPLNEDAFLHLATSRFQNKKDPVYASLLSEARKRRGRNIAVATSILRYSIIELDFEKFFKEVDLLLRIDEDNVDRYVGILTTLNANTGIRTLINAEARKGPRWGFSFFSGQIEQANQQSILSLRSPVKELINSGALSAAEETALKRQFLLALTQKGHLIEAFNTSQAWYPFKPIEGMEYNLITDPLFSREKWVSPFGWAYNNSQKSRVNKELNSGLFIVYKDVRPHLFLSQIFKLPTAEQANTLRVRFVGKIDGLANNGEFEWQLFCRDTNTIFSRNKIDRIKAQDVIEYQFDAKIPSTSCHFGEIKLVGLPGVYNNGMRFQLRQLEVLAIANDL